MTALWLITGMQLKKEVSFSGSTMGTTYHITVIMSYFDDAAPLKARIDKRLAEINQSMSIYLKDSDISRLNSRPAHSFVQVSDDFIQVMKTAKELYTVTRGAWDGTVGPLVNLWGFGTRENKRQIPLADDIRKTMESVGFNRIGIVKEHYLSKQDAEVFLDLGSIAKGFGVDQVAKLIEDNGIHDFIVEIGGEIYAAGLRKDGQEWRVGVNTPQKDAPADQVYKVVHLRDKAMATSGDYRNFLEMDGKIYSHVIDPKTGYPVSNHVVSVSVIADSCTYADGLATAVMVMGKTQGLKLVNSLNNVECLIIVMEKDGTLTDYYSTGFTR